MGILHQSRGTIISGGVFNSFCICSNHPPGGKEPGIDHLREHTLPRAIPDSSTCHSQRCLQGTREKYIRMVTSWANESSGTLQALSLLMSGPAGVGKSTIACTCAERIHAAGRLAAAFFFHPDNNLDMFIPTIVYQLTTRYPLYRKLINSIIINDRLVLHKSVDVQFLELLVKPLHWLSNRGEGLPTGTVIVVDGLNECGSSDAQVLLLELVFTSIRELTTPFRWAFFARPETHITRYFLSETFRWINLPISRDADADIELYLRSGFKTICTKYSIPPDVVWPPEEIMRQLVVQSAGLFVYAAAIIRYLSDGVGTRGPVEGLQLVSGVRCRERDSDGNPLSALNRFYIRIMEMIPPAMLQDVLLLLHLYIQNQSEGPPQLVHICSRLGLSLAGFYAAISPLSAVLFVTTEDALPSKISFYHKSFVDFLLDVKGSSPRFCIQGQVIRRLLLNRIACNLQFTSTTNHAKFLCWSDKQTNMEHIRWLILRELFLLVEEHEGELEQCVLQELARINWDALPSQASFQFDVRLFIRKIPRAWRSKIITPFRKGILGIPRQLASRIAPTKVQANVYLIGNGRNKALLVLDDYHNIWLNRC